MRLCHHNVNLRLRRRTTGISTDKTSSPSGIIQNPSIGRKPTKPPTISNTPIAIRQPRALGSGIVLEPNLIFMRSYSRVRNALVRRGSFCASSSSALRYARSALRIPTHAFRNESMCACSDRPHRPSGDVQSSDKTCRTANRIGRHTKSGRRCASVV